MSINNNTNFHKISIAPMMDCTDRHFRMIMRQITSKALLYTEMVVAQSLFFSKKKEKFLDFSKEEHPISIQFGGDEPKFLKEAAKMAQDWGYDEINFNVGCPSPRVSSGNFGASLMNSPYKAAKCIESLKSNSNLPVTIKHRIGVDSNDTFSNLNNFVRDINLAGADRFIVHARKALLKGLSPKENRTIPPLRYDIVEKLKERNPNLLIEINGGFTNITDCSIALKKFDGVMIGRSAYKHPLQWSNIDNAIYEEAASSKKTSTIILNLIPYIENWLTKEGTTWHICKHLINLIEGIPRAKIWRNKISTESLGRKLTIKKLTEITLEIKNSGY
ncbi:MAG: tRNA dihydrouridine(20/20a) synthase DusA [Prochlorococcus sp. SP3034]|nr:tRNA dihydrouridine(20/20a) synthase DusA [Prochlorococcus sp. SP3034]|tara:strand:+ start:14688 stop:15683 length:996 start_codon:yes stop_codon:yes gene_type:complete